MKDNDEAEDVVQSLFARLWEKQEQLSITSDITSYLYRSIHNESLNRLSARKRRLEMHVRYTASELQEPDAFQDKHQLSEEEISRKIDDVLAQMPEQCRKVFLKSRTEDLKYSEIAAELGISEKTVEAHMSKALKIIRNAVRVIVLVISLIAYLSLAV